MERLTDTSKDDGSRVHNSVRMNILSLLSALRSYRMYELDCTVLSDSIGGGFSQSQSLHSVQ